MSTNNRPDKLTLIISLILCIILGILFYACSHQEPDHNDGKCDICDRKATYSSKNKEEYCDEHAEDAIEWYYKQMLGDD